MVILVIAATDTMFPFLPLNINSQTWMWAISILITTIISSLVTEIISLNNRRAYISMGLAAMVSTVIFVDLSNFIQRTVMDTVQGVIPNPLLSNAVYAIVCTVIPGVLTGVVLGGIFGFFPLKLKENQGVQNPKSYDMPSYRSWSGFEKLCTRCNHPAPFESKFCPFCGVELTRQQAPPIRFCRFCSARIYLVGDYCPECGRDITILSKPSVYISQ
jgi:RNA polymerase subunit RPABC4/transcription elongation factor Spt4